MLKFNKNYSDYTDETDENYPEGKAVNASSSESYDGTPLLAEFMNDVNAAHIAMYEKAHGSRDGINGHADTQKASQFADSVAKYTDDKVKAHADKRGLADGVHGATPDAAVGQIMCRDEYGRAKVAAPVENNDIANKQWVLEAIYPVGSLYWSSVSTNPSQLFGGTWKQIKDCFVWAKGDSDTINATGGSKTVTLTEANMPSHRHSFTPSGTITMNAHSHGLNGHTHSFSGSGTTGGMSDNATGYVTGINYPTTHEWSGNISYSAYSRTKEEILDYGNKDTSSYRLNVNVSHIHSFSFSGTTDGSSSNTTFEKASGTFNGTTGTTDSKGSGTSFSILPPYVVKYCFERIA